MQLFKIGVTDYYILVSVQPEISCKKSKPSKEFACINVRNLADTVQPKN